MVRRLYFFSERVQRVSRGQLPQSMPREFDLDDLVLAMVDCRRPADTCMPLRTGRLLLVPINAKLTDIDAVLAVGLPFHIRTRGSNHFNAVVLLARDQDWCRDRARTLASVDAG